MTTRAELEADIRRLSAFIRGAHARDPFNEALDRAIARLRRDLAKLDGPAEGFVRVAIPVDVYEDGRWKAYGYRESGWLRTVVTADVRKPVPQVAEEIEGEVCDG